MKEKTQNNYVKRPEDLGIINQKWKKNMHDGRIEKVGENSERLRPS